MIAEAKKTGLPDYSPPKEQRDARRFLLNQCDGGAMGPVIQEISVQNSEVEPITLPATNFLTYLQALFFRGGSFHQLLASKRKQHPSSTSKPWSLVVYLDLGMVCQFPPIWPAPPFHRQLAQHSQPEVLTYLSHFVKTFSGGPKFPMLDFLQKFSGLDATKGFANTICLLYTTNHECYQFG